MKRTLINALLFFILISFNVYSQNWFPCHVGDEWQYLALSKHWDLDYGWWIYEYSLHNFQISKDTLINNQTYYKWSRYPNNWFRYDSVNLQTYIWFDSTDNLYRDFSFSQDTTVMLFDPSVDSFVSNDIYQSSINFNDSNLVAQRFHYFLPYDWDLKENNEYFTPNIGFVYFNSTYFLITTDYYIYYYMLQANINGINYSENYYPVIIYAPITFIVGLNFRDTIQVNHHYNHIYPANSWSVGVNFIDSVYIESFYSKGDSINNQPNRIGTNLPHTDLWSVNFPYDTELVNNGFKFNYRIKAIDKGLIPHVSFLPDSGYFTASKEDTITTVNKINKEKIKFSLFQNYPNPFNPTTKISWQSPVGSWQTLKVYDVLGREVATLVNGYKPAGKYEVEFDGSKYPSGIYFYKLTAGSRTQIKKLVLLK